MKARQELSDEQEEKATVEGEIQIEKKQECRQIRIKQAESGLAKHTAGRLNIPIARQWEHP